MTTSPEVNRLYAAWRRLGVNFSVLLISQTGVGRGHTLTSVGWVRSKWAAAIATAQRTD
jgi:hypothetical protein